MSSKFNKTDSSTSGISALREGDKILSFRVYKYLMGLTYLHNPSNDFRTVLARDMFVKSNPTAFFHVMHYLFTIIDPIGFKQNFYWPVERSTERIFRNTTIQYLNQLIIKYNLGFGPVPQYFAITPGSKKFLTVLLKVLRFVMRDVIRKKQKVRNLNDITLIDKSDHFTNHYMSEMSNKCRLSHEHCSKLVNKYTENIKILDNHTILLKSQLNSLINPQGSNIKTNLYCIKINECDITNLLNHQFNELEEQIAQYEQYTNTLHKFKTIVHEKISTNSTCLVHFDSAQFQKSTALLDKYNNEFVQDSSTNKLIKLKLSSLFVPNKSMINLIDLYDIVVFYASQIKHQFINHSNVNVKNLEINANVLEQYLIRLNKNCVQLTNLKLLINKYKRTADHSVLDNANLNNSTVYGTTGKVNIMVTPNLKWTNLNDMAFGQHSENTLGPNNNTVLLSALLSNKKLNRSAAKRTRIASLTETLNLDSSFEFQKTSATKPPADSHNKLSKTFKNININLNTDKFGSPETLESNPLLLSKDRSYKSILKNRNQPVSTITRNVGVSPTGKYDSVIKITEWNEDVDDTLLFKRTEYSIIEETIKRRPGSSSSLIDGYNSTNSSTAMQKTQITVGSGGDELNESGLELLQISDNVKTTPKRIFKPTNDSSKSSSNYSYRIIDTIDLTSNLLDTSDSCLNYITPQK